MSRAPRRLGIVSRLIRVLHARRHVLNSRERAGKCEPGDQLELAWILCELDRFEMFEEIVKLGGFCDPMLERIAALDPVKRRRRKK